MVPTKPFGEVNPTASPFVAPLANMAILPIGSFVNKELIYDGTEATISPIVEPDGTTSTRGWLLVIVEGVDVNSVDADAGEHYIRLDWTVQEDENLLNIEGPIRIGRYA